jgi:hypothetical protein
MAVFDFLKKNKKSVKSFDPRVEIATLGSLSPPSALVFLPKPGKADDDDPEELGKAFFLRRYKKLFSLNFRKTKLRRIPVPRPCSTDSVCNRGRRISAPTSPSLKA